MARVLIFVSGCSLGLLAGSYMSVGVTDGIRAFLGVIGILSMLAATILHVTGADRP